MQTLEPSSSSTRGIPTSGLKPGVPGTDSAPLFTAETADAVAPEIFSEQLAVRYDGFIEVLAPADDVPGRAQILFGAEMLKKKNLKETQKLHPLFGRGVKSSLALSIHEDRLLIRTRGKDEQAVVLEMHFRRIATVGSVGNAVLIICRRPTSDSSGPTGTFNCHKLTVPKGASKAENLAFRVSRLAKQSFANGGATPPTPRRAAAALEIKSNPLFVSNPLYTAGDAPGAATAASPTPSTTSSASFSSLRSLLRSPGPEGFAGLEGVDEGSELVDEQVQLDFGFGDGSVLHASMLDESLVESSYDYSSRRSSTASLSGFQSSSSLTGFKSSSSIMGGFMMSPSPASAVTPVPEEVDGDVIEGADDAADIDDQEQEETEEESGGGGVDAAEPSPIKGSGSQVSLPTTPEAGRQSTDDDGMPIFGSELARRVKGLFSGFSQQPGVISEEGGGLMHAPVAQSLRNMEAAIHKPATPTGPQKQIGQVLERRTHQQALPIFTSELTRRVKDLFKGFDGTPQKVAASIPLQRLGSELDGSISESAAKEIDDLGTPVKEDVLEGVDQGEFEGFVAPSVHYCGKAEIGCSLEDDAEVLADVRSAKEELRLNGSCPVMLKVTSSHMRFESLDESFALWFKSSVNDIARIDHLDSTWVMVTFIFSPEAHDACESDEHLARAGHIVQAFELDTEKEAVELCAALRDTLKSSTNLFV